MNDVLSKWMTLISLELLDMPAFDKEVTINFYLLSFIILSGEVLYACMIKIMVTVMIIHIYVRLDKGKKVRIKS